MDSQKFLAEFGWIAAAPNGVQKLREMVLSLAFSGRLVPNVEESVETTLISIQKQIDNFRNEPGSNRLLRKEKQLRVKLFEIPNNWKWLSLSDIGHHWGQCIPESDFTYIDIAAINNKRGVINESLDILKPSEAPSRARKLVRLGTVIYSTVRPYLLNIAVVGKNYKPKAIASTAFAVIHPWDGILSDYVRYWLRSPFFVSLVEQYQTGTAYPAINDDFFFSSPIPLSHPTEQKRIVAKVDELMSLIDRLDDLQARRKIQREVLTKELLRSLAQGNADAMQRTLHNLSHLVTAADQIPEIRNAILSLAVRGRLLQQNSEEENAEKFLRTMGANKELFLDTKDLPPGWAKIQFQALAEISSGLTLGRSLKGKKTIPLPYLRVANVKRGCLDLSVLKQVEVTENEFQRFSLKKGDILMTEGGDWDKVGRAVIWNEEIPRCLHQNHIFKGRPYSSKLNSMWLERWFNSPDGRAYFEKSAKQTTNLASINLRQVRSCPVPFPPLLEQGRLVRRMDELLSLCDNLEAKLRKANEVQEQMATSVVAALTGILIQGKKIMKVPKMELIARLTVGKKPSVRDHAPLVALLIRHKNELSPNALMQNSSLGIDEFYQQLKFEMNKGWIVQPETPFMKVEGRR